MTARSDEFARRKALLMRRAEVERVELSLALHGLRQAASPRRARVVGPPSPAARLGRLAILAAIPLFGSARAARLLAVAAAALTALRVLRGLRR